MGLERIKSDKKSENQALQNFSTSLTSNESGKSDSVLSDTKENIKLTNEQKQSVIQFENNPLTDDELEMLYKKMHEKIQKEFNKGFFDNYTFFKTIPTEIIKGIFGLGTEWDEVVEERKKANRNYPAERDIYDYYKQGGPLKPEAESILREQLSQKFSQDTTNVNIRKILDDKVKLETKSEKKEREYGNIGEGFADLLSGIAAFTAYTKTIGTGKVPNGTLAKVFGLTALVGGVVKTLITMVDDAFNTQYSRTDENHFWKKPSKLLRSFLTGAFSGVLAPITGGIGGKIGSKVARKAGLKVVDYGTGDIIKNGGGIKTMLSHPGGYQYSGGAKALVAGAYAAEMATDGVLGGAIDCGFRTAVDGGDLEEVKKASIEGGICGAIFAPVIGGIFKGLAKGIFGTSVFTRKKLKKDFKKEMEKFGREPGEIEKFTKYAEYLTGDNYEILLNLAKNKGVSIDEILSLSFFIQRNADITPLTKKILQNNSGYSIKDFIKMRSGYYGDWSKHEEFLDSILFDKSLNLSHESRVGIAAGISEINAEYIKNLCFNKELNFPKDYIGEFAVATHYSEKFKKVQELMSDSTIDFPKEYIGTIVNSGCSDEILKMFKTNPKYKSIILDFCKEKMSGKILGMIHEMHEYLGKSSISELTKPEKRKLISFLLKNKRNVSTNPYFNIEKWRLEELQKKIPLIPVNEQRYAKLMKELSLSLNISVEPVSAELTAKFNRTVLNLGAFLKSADLSALKEMNLTISHKKFISEVENIMSGLSEKEKIELQDFFGFKIIDGKLSGYPSVAGRELYSKKELSEVSEKLRKLVRDFTDNNFITVKDNPALNRQMKELSKTLPEIFSQIDGSEVPVKMLKSLQKIVKNPQFEKLSESDKRVLSVAALLHNTDKLSHNSTESAFDAYFIAKKFNMTEPEAQKVYNIVEGSDIIERFMNTKKSELLYFDKVREIDIERENVFDVFAFKNKDGNTFDLIKMLYSTKYKEGFTSRFDKLVAQRIKEFKSKDFILPQTTKKQLLKYGTKKTIMRDGVKYEVMVVNSKDIPDFYAYVHAPEAFNITGGLRSTNFANFDAFNILNDERVICTSYITNGKAGNVKRFKDGFIFEVGNSKQYVGYGDDICSGSKNIPRLLESYFSKTIHSSEDIYYRSFISDCIKSLLYRKDYNKETLRQIKEINKIIDKISDKESELWNMQTNNKKILEQFSPESKEYKKLMNDIYDIKREMRRLLLLQRNMTNKLSKNNAAFREIDEKYIARMDRVKEQLGGEPLTLERLKEIDPELEKVYRQFFSKTRNGFSREKVKALLSKDDHNEILVSNPTISGIFTKDIEALPTDYLIKAQEENLPVVIVKT